MSDEPWIDVDGDGHADPVTEIANPDGSVTYEHFDAHGHLDFVGVSEHGDGHVDYADYDTNHDGHFDQRLAASNPDGYLDHHVAGVDFSQDDALAAGAEPGGDGQHGEGHQVAPSEGPATGDSVGPTADSAAPAIGANIGPGVEHNGGSVPPSGAEPAESPHPDTPPYGGTIGDGISPYGS